MEELIKILKDKIANEENYYVKHGLKIALLEAEAIMKFEQLKIKGL